MKSYTAFALLPLLLTACSGPEEKEGSIETYCLQYDKPAIVFEESLPLGNGQLGALVYGGIHEERIPLNDITLWTGEPDLTPWSPEAWKHLDEVRQLLNKEDYAAANEANKKLQGHNSEIYQPLGTLLLTDMKASVTDPSAEDAYQRTLSLNEALATVTYTTPSYTMKRECFASAPDSVIVLRLKAEGDTDMSYRVGLTSLLPHHVRCQGNALWCEGYAAYSTKPEAGKSEWFHYDENRGIHFRTELRIMAPEGCVSLANDSVLLISGCKEACIVLANATSYNGPYNDPVREGRAYRKAVAERLANATHKSYEQLLARHKEDYCSLFNRMQINLGSTPDSLKALPTDEQLLRYTIANEMASTTPEASFSEEGQQATAARSANPDLEELYFQFGRYLLISSSRTEGVPANLQGLWNETITPPWSGNYTVNINVEENYWPAEVTALPEMHHPFLSWVKNMPRSGAITAQNYYAIPSNLSSPSHPWCLNHNSDIWNMTNPVGYHTDSPEWACWPLGGAWVCTHLWEHYSFTQDRTFLREVYPVMKGAVRFLQQWMVEKDGELITSPSTSPENHFITDKGVNSTTLYGGTADLAMIRELLIDTRKAALELYGSTETAEGAMSQEHLFADTLMQMICKLHPYQVGRKGNLQEWYYDWEDADPQHRHQSHLFGLYPGHHINDFDTPDLLQACARTLEIKGDRTTGWSSGWRVNLQARLRNGKEAYHVLTKLIKYVSPAGREDLSKHWGGGGTYPNLFDAHPPFQIDGNFGGTAGIAEMLVQSTDEGFITLLPALPAEWAKSGSIRGVRLRGGYELSMTWADGLVTALSIKSLRHDEGIQLQINAPDLDTKSVSVPAGQTVSVI